MVFVLVNVQSSEFSVLRSEFSVLRSKKIPTNRSGFF